MHVYDAELLRVRAHTYTNLDAAPPAFTCATSRLSAVRSIGAVIREETEHAFTHHFISSDAGTLARL